MSNYSRADLNAKLVVCSHTIKSLMRQIKEIEDDAQVPAIEKLSKIKIIHGELSKVGMEIDIVKKSLTLLATYNIN